jgi:putative lipoprotein
VNHLGLPVGLCVVLGATAARASEPDPWWGADKGWHFGISIGIGAGGYGASAPWLPERWQRAATGAGVSIALGAGKELYDLSGRGDPSWRDFTWDLAGTAVGVGAAWLLDLAIGPAPHDGRRQSRAANAR